MAGAAVELEGVAIRRGRRLVLRDVTLAVPAGAVVLVRGDNGAGKTTLLQVLAGVAPARGAIRRAGARCAFVPERVALAGALRPADWLAGMDGVRGVRRPWRALGDDWALEGLDAPAARLSKGQLQRVVLAEALSSPASLLVLDEPWAGLDPAARDRLSGAIRSRVAGGAAVVVTDHSGSRGGGFAVDAAHVVRDGTVAADRAAAEPGVTIVARDRAGAIRRETVAAGRQDARLRALLDAGWSIDEVRRG